MLLVAWIGSQHTQQLHDRASRPSSALLMLLPVPAGRACRARGRVRGRRAGRRASAPGRCCSAARFRRSRRCWSATAGSRRPG
ncbi:MAG: hypothetical protein MZV64_28370 [Ignavibacteriales bacterium]|nr:hypothetical protein [Ignavibacteriales bacterium]